MILWALFVGAGLLGFAILVATVLLLLWRMVDAGLLWLELVIVAFFVVSVVFVLWERIAKSVSRS